jgi:hypothetical protein
MFPNANCDALGFDVVWCAAKRRFDGAWQQTTDRFSGIDARHVSNTLRIIAFPIPTMPARRAVPSRAMRIAVRRETTVTELQQAVMVTDATITP